MARARRAITRKAAVGLEGNRTRARHSKRTELQEVERIALVVHNRPNHIGPIKAIAAAAVVIFEVIVQVKGLSALQRGGTLDSPTILQLRHAAAHLRKSV